jgi:hypothetical protein
VKTPARNIALIAVILLFPNVMTDYAEAEQSPVVGKYFSESHPDPEYYIELKPDGTLVIAGKGRAIVGTYAVEGDQIIIKAPMQRPARFRLASGTLIDPDGMRWSKRSPSLPAQARRQENSSSVVSRYIPAFQKHDFKTVIDLTYSYQQEVARIKAANPQVLWPKLIGEYYQSKESSFSQQAGYEQNYAETLGAMVGDPAQNIRAMEAMVPSSCRWKISESRRERVTNQWNLQQFNQDTVFVTVDYPSWQDAPFADNKLLKETILQFTVESDAQLILGMARMPAADTYIEDPLRISSVTWNQFNRPSMLFTVAGGTQPYSCITQVGPLRTERSCYNPGAKALHAEFDFGDLGRPPWPVHLKVSDSKGRTDEVFFLVPGFLPGLGGTSLFKYCWVREPWYQKGALRPEDPKACKDGVNRLGGSAEEMGIPPATAQASQPSLGEPSAPQPANVGTARCGDYRGCLSSGVAALKQKNWSSASADFQAASALDPSKPNAWTALGLADLPLGLGANLPPLWDKALKLGGSIGFGVWLELPLHSESGTFTLSSSEVSFVNPNGQKVFAVPPSQVAALGAGRIQNRALFRLRVADKNFNFDLIPLGVPCQVGALIQCPEGGIQQQSIVANYVAQTLPKLASGTLGPVAAPSPETASSIPDGRIAAVGAFKNECSTSEIPYCYSVDLWRQGDIVFGFFTSELMDADNPTGLLEDTKFEPQTGRLSFKARLSIGEVAPGKPSRDFFEFAGKLEKLALVGTLKISNRLQPTTAPTTRSVRFRRNGEGATPATYADWKKAADEIMKFRGPRW